MPDDGTPEEDLYELASLATETGNRIKGMRDAGRSEKDIAATFSGQVNEVLHSVDKPLSAIVKDLSDKSLSTGPQSGPYFRRKLAYAVKSGQFDQADGTA